MGDALKFSLKHVFQVLRHGDSENEKTNPSVSRSSQLPNFIFFSIRQIFIL